MATSRRIPFHARLTCGMTGQRFIFWSIQVIGRYLNQLNETLALQGHLILATFAVGGPDKCSGLDVVQYDAEKISATLGEAFRLVETINETHRTPTGAEQLFAYFWFIRKT